MEAEMRLAKVAEVLQGLSVDCEYAADFYRDTQWLLEQMREAARIAGWAAEEIECDLATSERLRRRHGVSATCAGDSTSWTTSSP